MVLCSNRKRPSLQTPHKLKLSQLLQSTCQHDKAPLSAGVKQVAGVRLEERSRRPLQRGCMLGGEVVWVEV